ncbi:MAG TPA: hypothetical protein VHB79_33235 [Polyangiaceae bacterium]|nr:hypothetical protein [Polyangiaceae bacterium]
MRTVAVALTFALALCVSRPARANGAFPFVSQLVSNSAHPEQLVLRGNFGLVVSRDAGKNWDWLCEAGMGYQNVEPPIALLDSGVIVLALPTGIARSDSSWCSFETLSATKGNFVDVSAEHAKPQAAVALSVDLNALSSQVWESLDDGKTFQPLGPAIKDFVATTIDVAATDAKVIYVSGTSSEGKGLLLRSGDHGASYQPHELPSSLLISTAPYISALDPKALDTVYVRSDSAPGTLMLTRDGGQKFEEMLRLSAPIKAFALSPDGSAVLAATVGSGIYRIDTATLKQDKLACTGVWCFTWTKDGVFACGDIVANGFLVAASTDEGRTFESLVTPTCVRGALACDAATTIGSACPDAWPSQRSLLGPNACITDVPEPDQGCFANAGSGMGGSAALAGAPGLAGAAGEGVTDGGSGDDSPPEGGAPNETPGGAAGKAMAMPPQPPSDASDGCDCKAAARGGGTDWAVLVLLALVGAVRRRK